MKKAFYVCCTKLSWVKVERVMKMITHDRNRKFAIVLAGGVFLCSPAFSAPPSTQESFDPAMLDAAYAKLNSKPRASAGGNVSTTPKQAMKDDAPPEIQNYFYGQKENYAAKQSKLAEVRHQVAAAKKSLHEISEDYAGTDANAKKLAMDDANQHIADLEAEEKVVVHADGSLPLFITPLHLMANGAIGRAHLVKIFQVVDEKTAIVSVSQVRDPDKPLEWSESTTENIWLTGVDTAGWTDDTAISRDEDLVISGTHKYATAMGSTKTIFEAKPFDIKDYLADPP